MELYTLGYKVSEILDETGDSLKRIDKDDDVLTSKLTNLFMNAKGSTRKNAVKEGKIPIVAKLLLIDIDNSGNPCNVILFDERRCPDGKKKVSMPGGHVEHEDINLCGTTLQYDNILHAAIFREIIEEMEGEDSFDDFQELIFTSSYDGTALSVFPGLLERYGLIMYNPSNREPDIYYQLIRSYGGITEEPFLLFYVPVYVKYESNFTYNAYYSNYIKFERNDYYFIEHLKRSGSDILSNFIYEYGEPAKDDIRLVDDNKPKSRIIPAIFNTDEIWNPIK